MKTKGRPDPSVCMGLLACLSAAAVWFFYSHGWLLYYGDAEAHLNIAREIVDSQTPGYNQIGTPWLPLPHLLMLPLVRIDAWWRTGLAGALPSAMAFVMAGSCLFAAARRIYNSTAAAAAATALFAVNPNVLYVQSAPMTEMAFFACLMAILYFSVRFRETGGWPALVGAGAACALAALTRYEGWFLIPFVAVYIVWIAPRRRLVSAGVILAISSLGVLYWLAHNWWLTGDPLAFYRGPYSARAIQGPAPYPGRGDWRLAWLYFRTAAALCAGSSVAWLGAAGVMACLLKRAFWPLALLGLPGAFYLWSMYSGVTPIFVPSLPPHAFYNTRYGLAALPFLSFAAAGLVILGPARFRSGIAVAVVAVGVAYWVAHPGRENWITWKESSENSEGRRQWVHEAAAYLASRYVRGSGIISASGEFRAVYREMGIPLREAFTVDNGLPWLATVRRPELFLWQQWAVVEGGDPVQTAINRAGRFGIHYRLEKTIIAKKEPVIEIYRRI